MNVLARRAISFLSVLLVVTVLTIQGANGPSTSSGLMARAVLVNGSTQIVRVEGVGCNESLCSTVLMKAKTSTNAVVEIRFDSIAAIRDIHPNDAFFVGRDGV